MQKHLTITQLKKYDINQKIIETLADHESRHLLFSIIRKPKTAAELSKQLSIPLSSVYKKLSDLEELTLIEIAKWMISDKGRRYRSYKSRISKAVINIQNKEPTITLIPNK